MFTMDDIKKIIGERIKYERMKRKISAEELGNYLDVSPSFVGLIERGKRGTNIKLLLKVCELFQISFDDIISSVKLKMSDNKNDEYTSRLETVNSLARTLNPSELDFIISSMRNLYKLRKDNDEASDESNDPKEEYFY